MGNPLSVIFGIILIGFAVGIFIYALPSISATTSTGNGTVYENRSSTVQSAISFTGDFILVVPFIMFVVGLSVFIKGL